MACGSVNSVSATQVQVMSKSYGAPDPILLTLFANRFMSVAEAMGKSLRQVEQMSNLRKYLTLITTIDRNINKYQGTP